MSNLIVVNKVPVVFNSFKKNITACAPTERVFLISFLSRSRCLKKRPNAQVRDQLGVYELKNNLEQIQH